jgi:enoyl-CoA hydratase/carnithine racemase
MGESLHIKWEIRGNSGIITLENPPQNFLNHPDFLKISQLNEWAGHPDVNGIIITGAGRHFSAGADLDELFKLAENKAFLIEKMNAGKQILEAIDNLNLPVIAAIGGVCFGGGLEIALACHMRICGTNSLFAFPEVNHNLIPGMGGTSRLQSILGHSKTLGILLSGDIINADDALKMRLVDYCVPQKEILDFCLNLMNRMVEGKIKEVVTSVMQAWHNNRRLNYREALSAETELFCHLAQEELKRRNNSK